MEVRSRGFVGKAVIQLLYSAGVAESRLRKAVKELGEDVEKANYWLWLCRKDTGYGQALP